ncbi:RQC trigger complex subunit Rqt4p [[Candida] anglica]|uniref:RQC trigger complex subunit Rqt4p n=1 Tax=[Candida] anglica TaxID=148631 RepID=A0ABP0EDR2_9ASCO
MSINSLKDYSVRAISDILPLDKETCSEMVDYVLTLSTDHDIREHFINLLGESDDAVNFIYKFIDTKNEINRAAKISQKKKLEEQRAVAAAKAAKSSGPAWTTDSKEKTKVNESSGKARLSTNKTSATTSQLLDIKPPKKDVSKQGAKRSKKKNLDNLKDIEAVLNELEISKDSIHGNEIGGISGPRRVCNCMATRHPLFEVAPNCLNCGKIICSKEGIQPCSFCGSELLSPQEKLEIANILQRERQELETITPASTPPPPSKQRSKKIVVTMNPGENLWKAQDRALKQADIEKKKANELLAKQQEEAKELEEQVQKINEYERTQGVDPALLKAQERLDTLLNFQATGTERTRIIDNAADFEMPSFNSSGSIWLTPVERALQLKKQQKQLRKHEQTASARTGRGKKVVEMVIRNGKVVMVEKQDDSIDDDDGTPEESNEIKELEDQLKQKKKLEEANLSKNTWDYEKDSTIWEKPVYIGESKEVPTENDELELKARVQLSNDAETNELLA